MGSLIDKCRESELEKEANDRGDSLYRSDSTSDLPDYYSYKESQIDLFEMIEEIEQKLKELKKCLK